MINKFDPYLYEAILDKVNGYTPIRSYGYTELYPQKHPEPSLNDAVPAGSPDPGTPNSPRASQLSGIHLRCQSYRLRYFCTGTVCVVLIVVRWG